MTDAANAVQVSTRRVRTPIYKVVLDRSGSVVHEGPKVCDNPHVAAEIFRAIVDDSPVEQFVVAALDTRRKIIGVSVVSVGTLSASLVHPREVFKSMILLNAAAVILGHNHPSGDQTPSSEDRDVTRRLQRAGELLGIPVADHVIFTHADHYSFRDHGLL